STAAAALVMARADLERARLDLSFTQVRAPVRGRISRTLVTRGNMVQSGETGGTLLTTIVSVDPVYAYFDVDDLTFLRIKHLLRQDGGGPDSGPLPPVEMGVGDEPG